LLKIGTGLSQKWEMVVGQEPAMGFSQNNFSLETSESKWVRFLAAATAHDTKWLRHFSGGVMRFNSFSVAFLIIMCQCRESAAQSDPLGVWCLMPRSTKFQWHCTIKMQISVSIYYKNRHYHHLIWHQKETYSCLIMLIKTACLPFNFGLR
jgi:hypothetical protein